MSRDILDNSQARKRGKESDYMATIQEIMSKKSGAFYSVIIKGNSNFLKKGLDSDLVKITRTCIRMGIRRSNMKIVQEIAQRNPNPTTTQRASWYHYCEGNTRLVEHNTTQEIFVKAYIKKGTKTKTTYYLNGVEVDKQWLKDNNYISKSEGSYNEVGDLLIKPQNLTFV